VAGTITALTFQKRNPDRVSVFLDGQFAFGLAALDAVQLRRGQALSDEEIAHLQTLNLRSKAYDRAVEFLAIRPRSVWEVKQNLRRYRPGRRRRQGTGKTSAKNTEANLEEVDLDAETEELEELEEIEEREDQAAESRGLAEETIDWVIQKLTDQGYLDDQIFAAYWIEQRNQFKPMAPRGLRYELRKKGVAAKIIDALLTDQVDADTAALDAARSRSTRWQHLDHADFKHKMAGFLQRRGFSWSAISTAVQTVWQEIQAEQQSTNHSPFNED